MNNDPDALIEQIESSKGGLSGFFINWGPDIAFSFGYILIAFGMATLALGWHWGFKAAIIAIAVIVTGVGIYLQIKQKEDVNQIRNLESVLRRQQTSLQYVEQAIEDYFEVILHHAAKTWGNCDVNERVSLYAHWDSYFHLVARYAALDKYSDSDRRKVPDDQGCLGQGWSEPKPVVINGIPDPERERDRYLAYLAALNIDEDAEKKITMKSRAFIVFQAEDSKGHRNAALLFESTNPTAFRPQQQDLMDFWKWGKAVIGNMLEYFEPVLATTRSKHEDAEGGHDG